MSVKTRNSIGAIRTITIPETFVVSKERYADFASSWMICYSPVGEENVEIGLVYRGKPVYIDDAVLFRSIVNKSDQKLFESDSSGQDFEKDKSLLKSMTFILGKMGNNQLTNTEKGVFGPEFYLERLETILLNGRRALSIKGHFQGPDLSIHNYYYGLLYERKRSSEKCDIEEVFFQAHSQELYDKYFFDFAATLKSIIWV